MNVLCKDGEVMLDQLDSWLCSPQDNVGEVLLLGGVPLGGQQQGEVLTSEGDEARLVGHPAEHVGRVTVGSLGGSSASQQGDGASQHAQGSTAVLQVYQNTFRLFRISFSFHCFAKSAYLLPIAQRYDG